MRNLYKYFETTMIIQNIKLVLSTRYIDFIEIELVVYTTVNCVPPGIDNVRTLLIEFFTNAF